MAGSHFTTQFLHHLKTVFLGHHDIANDNIRHQIQSLVKTFYPIRSFHNPIIGCKNAAKEQTQFRIVFNQQHQTLYRRQISLFRMYIFMFMRSLGFWHCNRWRIYSRYVQIALQNLYRFVIMFPSFQKINSEATAFAQLTIYRNACFVHLHQLAYQGQANTRTGLVKQIGIHQIFKTDKQRFLFVFCNSYTLILNANRHCLFILTHKHRNHFPLRSIFKGIRQKIIDNLFILIDIHPQIDRFLFCFEQEIDVVFLGQRLEIFHDLTSITYNFYMLDAHLHLLILNLTEV